MLIKFYPIHVPMIIRKEKWENKNQQPINGVDNYFYGFGVYWICVLHGDKNKHKFVKKVLIQSLIIMFDVKYTVIESFFRIFLCYLCPINNQIDKL